MILADNEADRRKALKKLLPYQRKDFQGIFKALAGRPATIRLLDPPLHEFLPHDLQAQRDLAKKLGVSLASIKKRVEDLHEFNPCLVTGDVVWAFLILKLLKCKLRQS